MKNIKRIISMLMAFSLILGLSGTALASGWQPRYDPGLNGKFYVISREQVGIENVTWSHLAKNESSPLPDTVTKSVTRSMSFTGSLSGETEVKALLAGVKFTAEVAFGRTSSTTVTRSYSIPAYSNWYCLFGSVMCKTSGDMETWTNGVRTSVRSVFAEYSYDEFSDKKPA